MDKQTISVQELSSQLGISLPKAYELVKTPGFPVIRIGTWEYSEKRRLSMPLTARLNSMVPPMITQ